MKSHTSSQFSVAFACRALTTLASSLLALTVLADPNPTPLATEPFVLSSSIRALPNVMFVLDDSGSMNDEFLPDWAGPYIVAGTTMTPPSLFFNSSYNGLAYNPALVYRPPTMYKADGSPDTTTYPSMNGKSSAAGGDASATPAAPNWHQLKNDGYGIQSLAKVDLESLPRRYYTTIAGEYCAAANLRQCIAASGPSVSGGVTYNFAAPLRWCKDAASATGTTAAANVNCQASRIDADVANGITGYTHARIAAQRSSVLTIGAAGTVSSVKVDGNELLSTLVTGSSSSDLATKLATSISTCTYNKSGACSTIGYRAQAVADKVWIYGVNATTSTPVVTATVSVTPTAFGGGNVPGATWYVVISPDVASYPYPGSATKAASRTDCAGTTCTYAEEMTNYANWHSYYRSRMQMMKTASSVAFSGLSDKFRVGYFSINNGTGSDFLGVNDFNGAQRHAWYSKFFAAKPYGPTPLRTGLSNAGKYYAGKLSTLNGQAVTDPMQYSCQQNYTILSTDGYWNDAVEPKNLLGAPIGQQDGDLDRPFYDGARYTKNVSWHEETKTKLGVTKKLETATTWQLLQTKEQIDQTVVTEVDYPNTLTEFQLQKNEKSLTKRVYALQKRVYQVQEKTRPLYKDTYDIDERVLPLQRYYWRTQSVTTPLNLQKTLLTVETYPLQQWTDRLKQSNYKLMTGDLFWSKTITPGQKRTDQATTTDYPLQESVFNVDKTVYQLQKNVRKLRRIETQLQRTRKETAGGEAYYLVGPVNVSSCVPGESGVTTGGERFKDTVCSYAPKSDTSGNASCTQANENYASVENPVSCTYEAAVTEDVLPSGTACTVGSASAGADKSAYVESCTYALTATPELGETDMPGGCAANDQSTADKTGNKVVCTYRATAKSTTNAATCTATTSNTGAAVKKTCAYGATAILNAQPVGTACTGKDQTGTPAGTQWSGDKRVCGWQTGSWGFAGAGGCTAGGSYATGSMTFCQFGVTPGSTNAGTPSPYNLTACTANANAAAGDKVECTAQGTPASWTAVGVGICTPVALTATAKGTACKYDTTAADTWPSSAPGCTVKNAAAATGSLLSSAYTGDKVSCTYVNGTFANAASCSPTNTSGDVAQGDRILCQFRSTPSSAPTGQNSCTGTHTAHSTGTNLTVALSGNKVACSLDTTPQTATPLAAGASCTWVVPDASNPAVPKVTCSYDASRATNVYGTCTPVAEGTVTTNGTTWEPSVACNPSVLYYTQTLSGGATCTPGDMNGKNYDGTTLVGVTTTCGWAAWSTISPTTKTTCAGTSPGTISGGVYSGTGLDCQHQSTKTTVGINTDVYSSPDPRASCTATTSAQNSTATQQKIECRAGSWSSSWSNASTCVARAENLSTGPARQCQFSASIKDQNLNATDCTTNDLTSAGDRVQCTYATGGDIVETPNASSCKQRTAQSGPIFTGGAAETCTWGGAYSGWADVTSGDCIVNNEIAVAEGVAITAPARQCQYVTKATSGVGNPCPSGLPAKSIGPNFTVLNPKECTNTAFTTTGSVTNTVDHCEVGALVTPTAAGVTTTKTTSCAFRSPVTSNLAAISCTPSGGQSGAVYNTRVTCPAVTPTTAPVVGCTTLGGGGYYEAATGLIRTCTTTDETPYNTDYPVGSPWVPVASCTEGLTVHPTTKVQTTCVKMPGSSGPTAVQTCTPLTATAPHYLSITCTHPSSDTAVSGCVPVAATGPLWQTTTCTPLSGGSENTLADVAMYYYRNDLRTPALGNCTGAVVSPSVTGTVLCSPTEDMNNVPTTLADPNPAQHMTTFTLGLGASGYMRYSSSYSTDIVPPGYASNPAGYNNAPGDFPMVKGVSPHRSSDGIDANPTVGACSWQSTGHCNWPVPVSDEQTTIDDLWHAGVNGHGAYFSATDPSSLSSSLSQTLASIDTKSAVAASSSVSNPVLAPGDSYAFSAAYTSVEWTGDVMRMTLDPISGAPSGVYDWQAQSKLDSKDPATRKIYLYDGVAANKLKEFTAANFASDNDFKEPNITGLTQFTCTSPDVCLSSADKADAAGAKLVNYLRGDRAWEGLINDNTRYFRKREHILGDIVNSQTVYVDAPYFNYVDPGYGQFKNSKVNRKPVVYVGANDGMLHAFAATGTTATEALVKEAAIKKLASSRDPTNPTKAGEAATALSAAAAAMAADTTVGQELWAYIPAKVKKHLHHLADKRYADKHRYFVDATPVIGDVCVSDCTSDTAVWKTILVGGLGRGGRGYYALDITDPDNPKGLWEFSDDNIGYTYGQPQIGKLADGTWVVALSSGYNNIPNDDGSNGDGVGRLYVVKASDGTQITGSPISTDVGDDDDPSGLARITMPVISASTNATIIGVYGGDLFGNLWRFDLNDAVGPSGLEAQLLAKLEDGDGKAQPITAKPVVSLVQQKYIVMLGTGRFLASSDAAANTNINSIYGIIDPMSTGGTASDAIYDNPGGKPRLLNPGVNGNSFIMQKMAEVDCPAGSPANLCTGTEKVLQMVTNSVKADYNTHKGWFIDLIHESERANLDPALGLGTLVFNTNAPTSNACDLGGKSYQYWLDYKDGGAIRSVDNPGLLMGKKISDSLVAGAGIVQSEDGLRVLTNEPCVGPNCIKVTIPPVSDEASITRRTSWRELIVE